MNERVSFRVHTVFVLHFESVFIKSDGRQRLFITLAQYFKDGVNSLAKRAALAMSEDSKVIPSLNEAYAKYTAETHKNQLLKGG